MVYTIIDNFLDKNLYQKISNFMKSKIPPWYFVDKDTDYSNNKNGYYCCCFYNHNRPDYSYYYEIALPILSKLDFIAPIEVRSNLNFRDKDAIECGFHSDNDHPHSTTAILFLTTCNAKTVLKVNQKEIIVDNIENRIVIFNSQVQHKVIYQTDVHKRHIINLNYFGRMVYGN